MNKSLYKRLGLGAFISFLVSLLGVVSLYIFNPYFEEGANFNVYIDYFAGKTVQALSIIGVLFSFYFCIRIIVQTFKDNKTISSNKEYVLLFGLLSSIVLILMGRFSEYSLPLLYKCFGRYYFYIAVVLDIPTYFAVITSIYFYLSLVKHLFKSQKTE